MKYIHTPAFKFFAKQSEVKELESWCMDILHAVQEEVRDYFTFDIRLIGSGDKRLVTQNSDESFDLDYNIILQQADRYKYRKYIAAFYRA